MDIRRFGAQYRSGSYTLARTREVYETYYDIHYPNEERLAGRPLRLSPTYPRLAALGCSFGEKSGWERPNWFEANAAGAGLADPAALEALRHGWDSMQQMRAQYHRRRDLVVRRFNEIGLKCHAPRGSFYAFPNVAVTGLSEKDFAVGLLQEHKVAVVPGTAFGANGAGHVRACFATSYEQLVEACDRIERFVQAKAK